MRVSEIYLSVQGEGPNVGASTVFIRFGGCNLRCPGWPCDTQHAIDPAFRKEWTPMAPDEIIDQVAAITSHMDEVNVCLTGGEPFLQPKQEMIDLVKGLERMDHISEIEAFTNGALEWPEEILGDVDFVMDWKLPGSGEAHPKDYTPRLDKAKNMTEFDAIKFTIKTKADLEEAIAIYMQDLVPNEVTAQIFYGVVWDGDFTNAQLVNEVLSCGLAWKLNVQVHNHVFDRQQRGI